MNKWGWVGLALALLVSPAWANDEPLWKQAEAAYERGDHNQGNESLKSLIEKNPGNMALASRCLMKMRSSGANDSGKFDTHWESYIREGLVALERLGGVSAEVWEVRQAIEDSLEKRAAQGRLFDVIEDLDRLVAENPGSLHWQWERAKGYRGVDSSKSQGHYQKLKQRMDLNHPHYGIRGIWESLNQELESDHRVSFPRQIRPLPPGSPLVEMEPDDPDGLWQNLLANPAQRSVQKIDRLMSESLIEDQVVLWKDHSGLVDPVHALDLHLMHQAPALRLAIGKVQDVRLDETMAKTAVSDPQILQLSRRYPWAQASQKRLLVLAHRSLWAGRPQAAIRSYRTLLKHAKDPALRQAAQVGMWMASAHVVSKSQLKAMFKDVDPAKSFPWMGKTATAQDIHAALQKGRMAEDPLAETDLTQAKVHWVNMPPITPWPAGAAWGASHVDLQIDGDQLLASGRNVLALFEAANPSRPLWYRLRREHSEDKRFGTFYPGYFRPMSVGGRFFTRWGVQSVPSSIVALDRATGRPLWSTRSQNPSYDRHRSRTHHVPMGDPVWMDGRLVFLQWNSQHDIRHGRGRMLSLVAFDPVRRERAWEGVISRSGHVTDLQARFERASSQWAIYGNRVTVQDGSVYINSNSGVVARSDARDGRTDWAHFYRRSPHGRSHASFGAAPVLHAGLVIFAPKDAGRVFALDQQTGRLVWDNPLVLPVELLGVTENVLVVRGRQNLVGLETSNGQLKWTVPMLTDAVGRVQRVGQSVYMADVDGLHRLDARTGQTLQKRPWPSRSQRPMGFLVHGPSVFVVTDRPMEDPDQKMGTPINADAPEPAKDQPLTLPLKERWALHRGSMQWAIPSKGSSLKGKAYLLTGGILECVDVSAQGAILWRRFVGLRDPGLTFVDGRLLAVERSHSRFDNRSNRITAFDGQTGKVLWAQSLKRGYDRMQTFGRYILLHDQRSSLGVVDVMAGRVLWEHQFSSARFMKPVWRNQKIHVFHAGYSRLPAHLQLDPKSGRLLEMQKIHLKNSSDQNNATRLDSGFYQVKFKPVTARHVRLVALSDVGQRGWASGAELRIEKQDGALIDPKGWVGKTDSWEKTRPDTQAKSLFDQNLDTFWHTQWIGRIPGHPHHVDIDLGVEQVIGGFQYYPARVVNQNGTITQYQFQVSRNGKDWSEPVAKGQLVQHLRVYRIEVVGQRIFMEIYNHSTRKKDLYRYDWQGKQASLVARETEIYRVVGEYLLARVQGNNKLPMTVYASQDPKYQLKLEGVRQSGEMFAEGDRLILNDQHPTVVDLKSKAIRRLSPPGQAARHRGGWVMLSGKDQLLKFTNHGNAGQVVHRFDLKTGETSEFKISNQWQPFKKMVERLNPYAISRFGNVILLYDGTRLMAWSSEPANP